MNGTAFQGNPPGRAHPPRFSQYFLLVLLIVSFLAFLRVIRIFLLQIVVAAVFATLFYPLYRWFDRLLGGRNGWASLVCCIVIFIGFLVPVVVISNLVAKQAVELYQNAEPRVVEFLKKDDASILGKIRELPVYRWLAAFPIDWRSSLRESLKTIGTATAYIINKTSRATITFVIDVFIVFFALFYFFRDGQSIISRLLYVIPLDRVYKERLIARFVAIAGATVKSTLVIGVIQGSIGAVTFSMFGIRTWLLWGVVMFFLSIIPVLGAWTVMVPAGIVLIIEGRLWPGIVIILISTFVIALIDNILRPILVGHGARMHDLLTFFTTLGGLAVFGVMGFIIGPMIAALFLTILDIYTLEFRESLDRPSGTPPV